MPCRKLEEESNLCTSFMVQPPFPCQPSLCYHTSLLSTLFSSSHFNTQYLFPSKLSLTFQKFLLFLLTCLEQNFQVPGGVQLHKNPMLNYYPGVRDYMGFYRCSRNKECHMNYCVSWTKPRDLGRQRKQEIVLHKSLLWLLYYLWYSGFNCILFLLTCRFLEFSSFNLLYSCFVSFLTLKMTFNYLEKKWKPVMWY